MGDGEMASCSVRPTPVGADLHHGTDIADLETYKIWEARVLRYVACSSPEEPKPLQDMPRASAAGAAMWQPQWQQAPWLTGGDLQAGPPVASQGAVSSSQVSADSISSQRG